MAPHLYTQLYNFYTFINIQGILIPLPNQSETALVSDVIDKIQEAAVRRLNQMVQQVLDDTVPQIVDPIADFKALSQQSNEILTRFVTNLSNSFDQLKGLEVTEEQTIFNFETLSLVQEEELDLIVALEGMVNAARNEHLAVHIGFNTRLSALFPRKRLDESTNPLDPNQLATAFVEALKPLELDPKNSMAVYRGFNNSVLKKVDEVIKEANTLLVESNVLADMGMEAAAKNPSTARNSRRKTDTDGLDDIDKEPFDDDGEQPELFSVMQHLLHSDERAQPTGSDSGDRTAAVSGTGGVTEMTAAAPTGEFVIPAGIASEPTARPVEPGQPAVATTEPILLKKDQNLQMVDQARLMEILSDVQGKLSAGPAIAGSTIKEVERLDIWQSLDEILQESQKEDNMVNAIDRHSSDIINLVTLLYKAIWQDPSVPIPIKELIGRTQITIIKIALADVAFFNNENHPARAILNEFASAGIDWTEAEPLTKDPLYQKIQELVEIILSDSKHDNEFFEGLIEDFRIFRAQETTKTQQLGRRILKDSERSYRLDDIHQLVSEKIEERVLGRKIHTFVEELLTGPFKKFMVMLVLKEGPGSNAWKRAINTIDVILWSVQPHQENGDRERLDNINPRLLNNLRKAFRIASVSNEESYELITRFQAVQNETFLRAEADNVIALRTVTKPSLEQAKSTASAQSFQAANEKKEVNEEQQVTTEMTDQGPPEKTLDVRRFEAEAKSKPVSENRVPEKATKATIEFAANHPAVARVDNLSVGMWVEFAGENNHNTRCKLAAKISAIDKFIFVNRQGVKVVEKTKMGLAGELHDGTVSIISDGLLFSRALESVIGDLRDSQQAQQSGSAYQPHHG